MLEEAFDWLLEQAPAEAREGLVHGDYRIGNTLIDDVTLTAVLDWELVYVGDVRFDLGYLALERSAGKHLRRRVPLMGTFTDEDWFLERYGELTGAPVTAEIARAVPDARDHDAARDADHRGVDARQRQDKGLPDGLGAQLVPGTARRHGEVDEVVTNGAPKRGICVFAASIEAMSDAASAADGAGFDTVWTSELYNRSATITMAACAMKTEKAVLGTGILYGVGRSPLMLAAEAADLDELSKGRFVLGIGNGTRRMISDWHGQDGDAPAVRLEELIPLVRRVWNLADGPIKHDGRFYHLHISSLGDLAKPARDIPIYGAAVNPRMTEACGRVADGVLAHTMCSPQYLESVIKPEVAKGEKHADREAGSCKVATYTLGACSDDEDEARREAAAMIAFYASVKSYGALFTACGFGAEAAKVREAFGSRDLKGMVAAVTDAMVDEFSVAGTPQQVAEKLARYDGVVDEVVLTVPSFQISEERVAENLALLTEHCAPAR